MTILTSDVFCYEKKLPSFPVCSPTCPVVLHDPGSATVLEVTVRGTVSDISVVNDTLTLLNPQQYGCNYGSGTSAPVCSWSPINATAITGTVPDAAAFSVFAKNDQVVAVSFGGTRWGMDRACKTVTAQVPVRIMPLMRSVISAVSRYHSSVTIR